MHTIQMINRLPLPSADHSSDVTPSAHASAGTPPRVSERLDELLPLIDFVPEAGPPLLFVLGPWLFVVLMLIGPFVLLLTLVLATMLFVAIAAALVLLPYLVVHQLRKGWPHRPALHT